MIRLCHPQLSEGAIAAVAAVLRSGDLVQGEQVRAFEDALARYLGVDHAIAVSSGTAALHLSLLALDVGLDDEVICPAFTFPATVNVVERVGAHPVLVDIGADFNMDAPRSVFPWSTQTRALIVVHAFGQPAAIAGVCEMAAAAGVPVIEDAACALGATYDGRRVGTFGKLGCFSFHPRKALTTGEGGLVVSNDERLAERVRSLRDHGRVPGTSGAAAFKYAGLNYRMTEFQAVLGHAQMLDIDRNISLRSKVAAQYDLLLGASVGVHLPAKLPGRGHSFQSYHMLLPERPDRDEVIAALRAREIETAPGAQAINCLPYYQERYGWRRDDCPNATIAAKRGLALPIGAHVSPNDVSRVAQELTAALRGRA